MERRLALALLAVIAADAGCHRPPPAPPAANPASVAAAPAAPAVAAPAATPAAADAKSEVLAHPLLWVLEKDGHTSYALGTIHLGVDAVRQLPPVVWDKLDHAPAFAMETDIHDPSLARDLSARPQGGTLHGDLGDAYWQKLESELSPQLAERLDAMPATVAVTVLETRVLPQTAAPMDAVLLGRAQERHHRVIYLEPVHVQTALLAKWMNVRALEELLDHEATHDDLVRRLLAAYLAGDVNQMLALDEDDHRMWLQDGRPEAEYVQMRKEMLYDRNASWIDEIDRMHAAGGGFIAVGAMHLIGPHSVLELLQQRGYKVSRLTP